MSIPLPNIKVTVATLEAGEGECWICTEPFAVGERAVMIHVMQEEREPDFLHLRCFQYLLFCLDSWNARVEGMNQVVVSDTVN